jgi:hypothetical protein
VFPNLWALFPANNLKRLEDILTSWIIRSLEGTNSKTQMKAEEPLCGVERLNFLGFDLSRS